MRPRRYKSSSIIASKMLKVEISKRTSESFTETSTTVLSISLDHSYAAAAPPISHFDELPELDQSVIVDILRSAVAVVVNGTNQHHIAAVSENIEDMQIGLQEGGDNDVNLSSSPLVLDNDAIDSESVGWTKETMCLFDNMSIADILKLMKSPVIVIPRSEQYVKFEGRYITLDEKESVLSDRRMRQQNRDMKLRLLRRQKSAVSSRLRPRISNVFQSRTEVIDRRSKEIAGRSLDLKVTTDSTPNRPKGSANLGSGKRVLKTKRSNNRIQVKVEDCGNCGGSTKALIDDVDMQPLDVDEELDVKPVFKSRTRKTQRTRESMVDEKFMTPDSCSATSFSGGNEDICRTRFGRIRKQKKIFEPAMDPIVPRDHKFSIASTAVNLANRFKRAHARKAAGSGSTSVTHLASTMDTGDYTSHSGIIRSSHFAGGIGDVSLDPGSFNDFEMGLKLQPRKQSTGNKLQKIYMNYELLGDQPVMDGFLSGEGFKADLASMNLVGESDVQVGDEIIFNANSPIMSAYKVLSVNKEEDVCTVIYIDLRNAQSPPVKSVRADLATAHDLQKIRDNYLASVATSTPSCDTVSSSLPHSSTRYWNLAAPMADPSASLVDLSGEVVPVSSLPGRQSVASIDSLPMHTRSNTMAILDATMLVDVDVDDSMSMPAAPLSEIAGVADVPVGYDETVADVHVLGFDINVDGVVNMHAALEVCCKWAGGDYETKELFRSTQSEILSSLLDRLARHKDLSAVAYRVHE